MARFPEDDLDTLRSPPHQQDADMAWLQPRLVDEPGNRQWVWTLPQRPLGHIKNVALGMGIAMACATVAFSVFFQIQWLGPRNAASTQAWQLFDWLPIFFFVPGWLMVLGMLRLVWRFTLGTTTICLTDDAIEISDGLAIKVSQWFRKPTRRMALAKVGQLEIATFAQSIADSQTSTPRDPETTPTETTTSSSNSEMFTLLGTLQAHPAKDDASPKRRPQKPTALAIGYPPAWLNALADAIVERMPANAQAAGEHTPRVVDNAVYADGSSGRGPLTKQPIPKPDKTKITLESSPEGLTIHVPPPGIWKGSKGGFVFAIIWLLFSTFMFTMFAVAHFTNGGMWFPVLFIAVFVAIGVAMLFFAIKNGRTRAIIDVVGQGEQATMLVNIQHPFGHKQHEWHASELNRVCMDATGTKINDVPVMALYFHPMEGKKVGILPANSNEELQWMASEIRQATGLPA